MTTEVVTVEPSTPFMEIVARFAGHRISEVPVVGADRRVLGSSARPICCSRRRNTPTLRRTPL
jgi:CBS domain-containing protein